MRLWRGGGDWNIVACLSKSLKWSWSLSLSLLLQSYNYVVAAAAAADDDNSNWQFGTAIRWAERESVGLPLITATSLIVASNNHNCSRDRRRRRRRPLSSSYEQPWHSHVHHGNSFAMLLIYKWRRWRRRSKLNEQHGVVGCRKWKSTFFSVFTV